MAGIPGRLRAERRHAQRSRRRRGLHVREAVRLECPIEEVYRFWRALENLPRFMAHLESVDRPAAADARTGWPAGPAGMRVEWDAEIINEVENKVIGWRSLPGSDVVTAGSVNFDRRARRAQHAGHRASAVRAAGRHARAISSARAVRPRAVADDPRGPAPPEAAARSRRDRAGRLDRSAARCAMKAVCYYGKEDIRVERVPDPEILNPRDAIVKSHGDRDLRIGPAHLRRLHSDDGAGRHPRPRVHGRGRRGRPRQPRASKVGDRVVVPVHDRLRPLLLLQAKQLWSLCDNSNPNAWMAEKLSGYCGSGPVRLLAHVRRLSRRPGRVRARAVRRRRADQGARIAVRRAGAVPLRHLSHRLHGGRELRHPAGRHRGRVGLRSGGPVRDQERLSARRRTRHRHRSLSRAAGAGRVARQGRGARLQRTSTCSRRCAR